MRALTVLSLFLVFSGHSFAQGYNVAAYQYHQSIVEAQQNIGKEVFEFNERATELNLKILKFEIEKSIAFIDSMHVKDIETTYRDAAKKLFLFYKDLAENEYTQLLTIIEDPELEFNDFKEKKRVIFESLKAKSAKAYPPFTAAQEAFCLKYGVKLN